jgi:hypothetical protein
MAATPQARLQGRGGPVRERCLAPRDFHELSFNLTDMRRWQRNGNPEMRKDLLVHFPKAIREERGLGQCRPPVTYAGDQGGHDANRRNARPKAQATSEGIRMDRWSSADWRTTSQGWSQVSWHDQDGCKY